MSVIGAPRLKELTGPGFLLLLLRDRNLLADSPMTAACGVGVRVGIPLGPGRELKGLGRALE